MKKTVAVVLGAVVGFSLTLAVVAQAAWPAVNVQKQPRYHVMSPKGPTIQTAGSAGELHWTLTEKGACIQFDCTVDSQFRTSASSAPSTATNANGNSLYAKTVRLMCMAINKDYLSIYLSAAGTCTVGELDAP